MSTLSRVSGDFTYTVDSIIEQFQLDDVFDQLKQDYFDSSSNMISNMCFSGSFAMELIRCKNNLDKLSPTNDLDIYIDTTQTTRPKIIRLLDLLKQSNFVIYSRNGSTKQYEALRCATSYKLAQRALHSKACNVSKDYISLKNHINLVLSMAHLDTGRNIDLIFTRIPIDQLLLETFDFDIVMNYVRYDICENSFNVFAFNENAIHAHVATISVDYLYENILPNMMTLHNFFNRCFKYSNDKYFHVQVGTLHINIEMLNAIVLAYLRIIGIKQLSKDSYKDIYDNNPSRSYDKSNLEIMRLHNYQIRNMRNIKERTLLCRYKKNDVAHKLSGFISTQMAQMV